ncbi:AhpC/TSA antioxidant enzyme-domain-containing protein [Achaetomium macrosporum]|uniref:AhpC/TSA antioxidant enzyme-domain-containing protein n=1 Tax=Achaetomium macrosporum TaxID=79813 RepID=A0AAN7CFA7_9PEZI|nr:AhpC/TSA antioxidant enzyme-domain-containing protein [Achaetomium macrosporum]
MASAPQAVPGAVPIDGGDSAKRPPTATTVGSAGSAPSQTDTAAVTGDDGVNPLEFDGSVDSNHDLPTLETIRKIDNYVVLDRDGKSHTFRSLYTGRHTARRVLIIFIRHFFCGNCQEYLRALSASSITPSSLLALPLSTFICVIGCGDPGLIDMYAAATNCPFPIYADPTRKLYAELGMVRTLALGQRPAYMKQHLLKSSLQSIAQGLKQIPKGLALKGGDSKQIGGEFLFEPVDVTTPVSTTAAGGEDEVGPPRAWEEAETEKRKRVSETSLDGKGEPGNEGEDKVVTWCHRMKTTRDHAEIPELMEVLGLDGHGRPVGDRESWERALRERKGTGKSLARRIREMNAEAWVA